MAADADPVTAYPGTLGLVMTLAGVAGFLDAISLARLTHTFVAFQTGNTVLVGLSVGRGHWSEAALPAVAVAAYVLGSALVPAVVVRETRARERVVPRLLAIAAALLLVESIVLAIGLGLDSDVAAPGRGLRYACIVLSGVAMAFQTPAVRRVAGVTVSSTFSTGMLTRLGQSLGSALREPMRRPRERVVVRVLGGTVLAFLVGAALGGTLLDPLGNATIALPFLALLSVALVARRVRPA